MAQMGVFSPSLKESVKSPPGRSSKSPPGRAAKSPTEPGGQAAGPGGAETQPAVPFRARRLAGAVRFVGRALLHNRGNQMTRAKLISILTIPVVLLLLPLYYRNKPSWCGYCMLLMAVYWATEVLPLAVTALLPMVLFPLTGLLTVEATTKNYFNNIGVVIFCSMVFTAALEVTHLDRRIALNALRMTGTSYSRILLGLMGVTMFLSMWIPNTAATSIVSPIVLTVVDLMKSTSIATRKTRSRTLNVQQYSAISEDTLMRVRNLMLLAVAYASNIGGTGSLIGTPPNIIMAGFVESRFPTANEPSFVSWMFYNVPIMLVLLLFSWMYMRRLLYGAMDEGTRTSNPDAEEAVMREVAKRCDELGHITFSESVVTFLLTLMILLSFTQKPHFIPGWSDAFAHHKMIKSSVPMVVVMTLLFVIPRESNVLGQGEQGIINWNEVSNHVNWGTILLICGGMTIADASTASGLSDLMVVGLELLDPVPDWMMVVLLCLLASVLTEFTSNSAICKLMLPVVLENATHRSIHPLYFSIPTTIGCSFAFLLPAATPPNAIVYHMGRMTPGDMAGPGLIMKIICVTTEIIAVNTWGSYVFNVNHYPQWARTKPY
ncbi:Na(+)/citrate cotransporter-like isoform X1 [Dermacentor albipictus]|uniref:Na(+)/citrate cotransporter-like isoform X1 n=1 Tax=Dermacentor albipictus TaxID=60249 RepID=UPI0038FD21AA